MRQRLKRFLLTLIKGTFMLAIVSLVVYGTYLSTDKSLQHSTLTEITARENVTEDVLPSQRAAAATSSTRGFDALELARARSPTPLEVPSYPVRRPAGAAEKKTTLPYCIRILWAQ